MYMERKPKDICCVTRRDSLNQSEMEEIANEPLPGTVHFFSKTYFPVVTSNPQNNEPHR